MYALFESYTNEYSQGDPRKVVISAFSVFEARRKELERAAAKAAAKAKAEVIAPINF